MKIKIVRSHPSYGYLAGDEVTLSKELTKEFLDLKLAVPADEELTQATEGFDVEAHQKAIEKARRGKLDKELAKKNPNIDENKVNVIEPDKS